MAAMTANQIMLIDAVAKNDMPKARAYAKRCIAEDGSKKNACDRERLARLLDPAQNPDLEKPPRKIEGMLEVEHPRESFQVERYYLSPREAALFSRIDRDRKVCEALMRMRISRSNTTLLHGASGTGKTTFGRFLAAMFDLPFYYVDFARLVDSLMGKTARNLAAVFDYVRTVPCVLMLDEIDTVSARRQGNGGGAEGELNRAVVTLMQEFDRLQNAQIVIGATNRLDVIDPALLRRFSRAHEVTVPQDGSEAFHIIRKLVDDCGIAYEHDELVDFCRNNIGESQAWFVNQAIERMADAVALNQALAGSGDAGLAESTLSLLGAFADGR